MSFKFFYNFCLTEVDDNDFQGDILSGIRRSYFNGVDRIRDKITINSDGDYISYDYSIEKDKPMRWIVKSSDGTLLQESSLADLGKYYICFYKDEVLFKRLLFSRLHTLLRVEYFDSKTGIQHMTLEPRKAPNGLCILYTSRTLPMPEVLYEIPQADNERVENALKERFKNYRVLASTDSGIIRFLSNKQLEEYKALKEEIEYEIANEKEESFVEDTPLYDKLNAKDFNVKRNLSAALDITMADEFTFRSMDNDFIVKSEEPVAEEPAAETEIIEPAVEVSEIVDTVLPDEPVEDEIAQEDAPAVEKTEPTDLSDEAESEELIVTAPEAVRAEEFDEDISDETTASKPDKLIMADGALYSYYGELDEQGNRSGYGRTLTDEGKTAYEGHYLNDKRTGSGSYYYKNGTLCYTGDWIDNVRHGVGVGVSSQDGSIHVGNWSYNKPVGTGVRLTADGDIKFVCKELSDGTTVLMNYLPDDTVTIAKYDVNGKKISEENRSLKDF